MSRRLVTTVLIAFALALAGAALGCGGDDEKAATDPGNTEAARDAETQARKEVNRRIREEGRKRRRAAKVRREARARTPAQRAATARRRTRRAAVRRERERERDRKADRRFDRDFKESAFDKLVGKLPIRKPPLHVQQYITTSGSHRVYTAVDRGRFLCRMTPAQRRKAVAGFFRAADRVMRAGGIDDFAQTVTVTTQDAQDLPVLARAKRGSVTLTGQGRERSPC